MATTATTTIDVVSEEEERYIRLNSLFLKYGNKTLQDYLGRFYTTNDPAIFYQELYQKNAKLKSMKQKRILNTSQWEILFPADKRTLISKFDITLIISLLRETCGLSKPVTGWEIEPNPTDKTPSADLVRLRISRNKQIHLPSPALTKPEYNKQWTIVSESLIRLGCNVNEILKLEKCSLDVKTSVELCRKQKQHLSDLQKIKHLEDKLDGVWYNVPKSLKCFVGREDDIESIHHTLHDINKSSVTVISGFGGVGKTQTAICYANKFGSSDYQSNVIWISANGEGTLDAEFHNLAEHLELSIRDESGKYLNKKSIISRVYRFFADRPCLFILDNVNNLDEVLDFIPQLPPEIQHPKVLITSQYSDWSDNFSIFHLSVFPKVIAENFVVNYLTHNIDDNCIKEFCGLLGYLPLALHQAVSYMNKHGIGPGEYVDLFKFETEKLLGVNYPGEYSKTVLTTWEISLTRLKESENPNAIRLMNVMSFMDFKYIGKSFLKNIGFSLEELHGSLHTLALYSLIGYDEGVITVHPLVQQVIRLSSNRNNTYFSIVYNAVKYLFAMVTGNIIYSNYSHMLLDMIHRRIPTGEPFTTHHDMSWVFHTVSLFSYCKHDKYIMSEMLKLVSPLYKELEYDGQHTFGLKFFKELLSILINIHGEQSKKLYALRNCVAMSSMRTGDLGEALKMLRKLSVDYKKAVGEKHLSSIFSNINLAQCLIEVGKVQDAKKILDTVLQPPVYSTLPDRSKLIVKGLTVCVYQQYGNHADALRIYQEVKSDVLSFFGENGPEILTYQYNEANCYFYLGEYEQSIKLFQQAKDISENIHGGSHQSTLSLNRGVGKCLMYQKKYVEALAILDETATKQQKILGEFHPDLLSTQYFQAQCLLDMGHLQKAKSTLQDLVERRKATLGEEHHYTMLSNVLLAEYLIRERKFIDAENLLSQTERKQTKMLNDGNPDVLYTRALLGICASRSGNMHKYTKIVSSLHSDKYHCNPSMIRLNQLMSEISALD